MSPTARSCGNGSGDIRARAVGTALSADDELAQHVNLHTKAHTFYGEIRGQIYAAPPESRSTKTNP